MVSLRDFAIIMWNTWGYAGVASSLIFMGNVFAAEIFGYMGKICYGLNGTDCTNVASYIEPNLYIKTFELAFVVWVGVFMLFKLKKWGVGVKAE